MRLVWGLLALDAKLLDAAGTNVAQLRNSACKWLVRMPYVAIRDSCSL